MRQIIDVVPYGHDNAVTRVELSRRTGLPRRELDTDYALEDQRGEQAYRSSEEVGSKWITDL